LASNEPGRIFAARELTLEELNRMAAEYMAAGELLDEAKKNHEEKRSRWKMMMEVKENHEKYYKQFPSGDLSRRHKAWR
jgi:hypothetical protein